MDIHVFITIGIPLYNRRMLSSNLRILDPSVEKDKK